MYRVFYSHYWPWFAGSWVVLIFGVYIGTVVAAGELFVNVFDPFVRYMLAFIAVQAAILVLLILCLVLWKISLTRRERESQSRTDHFRELLAGFTVGETQADKVLEMAGKFPREFLETAEEALRGLKGSARAQMESLVLKSKPYRDLFRPGSIRSPRQLLQSLSLLPLLGNTDSESALECSLSHSSPIVRLAAQITSLRCGNWNTRLKVLQAIPRLPFWEKIHVYLQFPNDCSLVAEFLEKALHSSHDDDVICALEFIISHGKLVTVPVPDSLAESSNREIRIKYFKAFHLYSSQGSTLSVLRKGLADEDWRVRAMSARACGLIKLTALIPELLGMVAQVRTSTEARRAAKALATLGGEAHRQLLNLKLTSPDTVHRIIAEAVEQEMLVGMEATL